MAISNYANLKASIGDFLNRSDLATDQSDGSTVIEKFIELAEAEFNRRLEAEVHGDQIHHLSLWTIYRPILCPD